MKMKKNNNTKIDELHRKLDAADQRLAKLTNSAYKMLLSYSEDRIGDRVRGLSRTCIHDIISLFETDIKNILIAHFFEENNEENESLVSIEESFNIYISRDLYSTRIPYFIPVLAGSDIFLKYIAFIAHAYESCSTDERLKKYLLNFFTTSMYKSRKRLLECGTALGEAGYILSNFIMDFCKGTKTVGSRTEDKKIVKAFDKRYPTKGPYTFQNIEVIPTYKKIVRGTDVVALKDITVTLKWIDGILRPVRTVSDRALVLLALIHNNKFGAKKVLTCDTIEQLLTCMHGKKRKDLPERTAQKNISHLKTKVLPQFNRRSGPLTKIEGAIGKSCKFRKQPEALIYISGTSDTGWTLETQSNRVQLILTDDILYRLRRKLFDKPTPSQLKKSS